MKTTQKIGLFGFGVVGTGLYQILASQEKRKHPFLLDKIAVRNHNKQRKFSTHLLATANDIYNTPQIEVVVEAIDDAQAALQIARRTLQSGKGLISANKKMLAENLLELIGLSVKHQVPLLYEAAVCGSIPIIRNLEDYYSFHAITELNGIINGSTNYILDQMQQHQESYQSALQKAQALGFAERDPSLDVEGFDASYKLQILILHAFGLYLKNEFIFRRGITDIGIDELRYAAQNDLKIKLIASAKLNDLQQLTDALVCPTLTKKSNPLSKIGGAQNAVLVGDQLIGFQLFEGQGAGDLATGSALFNDLSAAQRGYSYAYKRGIKTQEQPFAESSKKWVLGLKNKDLKNMRGVLPKIEKEFIIGNTYFVECLGSIQQIKELEKQFSFSLMRIPE